MDSKSINNKYVVLISAQNYGQGRGTNRQTDSQAALLHTVTVTLLSTGIICFSSYCDESLAQK